MNNLVLVSVGGPKAALSAMESGSLGQYLRGENLGDPATLLEVQETRIEDEEGESPRGIQWAESCGKASSPRCVFPILPPAGEQSVSGRSALFDPWA